VKVPAPRVTAVPVTVLGGVVVVVGAVVVVVVGAVVVVVVLSGRADDVGLPAVATRDCVVPLGADALSAGGSAGVDFDAVAVDAGGSLLSLLLERVSEFGDPLDDDAGVDDDGIVRSGVIDLLGKNPLLPVELSGVVGPLAMGSGSVGEPGPSARETKINTMPATPRVPIPFCTRRTFTGCVIFLCRLRFARRRSDIS
jgi:hypothetical protein